MIKVDLSNLTKFAKKVQKKLARDWVRIALESYGEKLVDVVVKEIERLKAQVSGDLKKSIHAEVSKLTHKWLLEVGTNLKTETGYPYPVGVHEGTKPHRPPIEPIKEWVRLKLNISDMVEQNKTAWRIWYSISKKGTAAHPFLKPVLKLGQAKFASDMQKEIGLVIERSRIV